MTQNVDHRLYLYNDIHIFQDEKLLAKLGIGDLIAQDAIYHNACRAAFNRRVERWKLITCNVHDFQTQIISSLSEWIGQRLSTEHFGMVKLVEVCEHYNVKLNKLGVTKKNSSHIHGSRLAKDVSYKLRLESSYIWA